MLSLIFVGKNMPSKMGMSSLYGPRVMKNKKSPGTPGLYMEVLNVEAFYKTVI